MFHDASSRCMSVWKSTRLRVMMAALAAISAFGLVGLDIVSPTFAQTPSPVVLIGVFDTDLADVKPEAIRQLREAAKKAHRDCYPPRATFKVIVFNKDLSFAKSLADARASALAAALPSLGLDPGQFKIETKVWVATEGLTVPDSVAVNYDKFDGADMDSPTLKVNSTPTKGTKVKAGDQIKVTIWASERYEDGHKSFPTGVQRIKLLADGGKLVDSKDYGPGPPPCEPRTFETTYTVPSNPPPIVHLRAVAEDAIGNKPSELTAEFPTGDTCNFWVGDVKSEVTDNTRGSISEPGTSVRKVTYHVRLLEGRRATGGSANLIDGKQTYVFEIPLINDGTTVEGSEDEDQSGPGGHRTSGFGATKLLNPGTNFGSVGHLLITDKGERVEYRFSLEPDFEDRLFKTTVRPNRGGSFDSQAGFLAVPIGGSTDTEPHRRITAGGHVVEGDYTYGSHGVLGRASWKLRTEIAPCVQPR